MAPVADLRRCTLGCGLILDPTAPAQAETVASTGTGQERRVQPHCGSSSPTCNWCVRCYKRRCSRIERGLNPNTGDPAA